jgi:hypothetical protein
MTSAFVIEIFHTTAGLAVREPGGFRFHASDPLFRRIDGQKFRHLKSIQSTVAGIVTAARAVESPLPFVRPPAAARHA